MDYNKKLLEGLLKADGIAPEGPTESERSVFGKMLDQQLESKKSKSNYRPGIWKIIMASKTTKFAAAAVIIIAALIAINHLGGSVDGTGLAWAQVIEELNNYEKYKCRQRIVREGRQHTIMDVYHMNLSLRRQEVEDGSIHIIDMQAEDVVTVELYPDKKKAVVTKLLGYGPKKDPHIISMVKKFEKESTERLGTKEAVGKKLHGFRHAPDKHNDYTVWVDPETRLPVEIELIHTNRGQTIFLDEFEFDFDLPKSAFSTEVPKGYEIENITQDYRPFEPRIIEPQEIQSKLNQTAYTIKKLPWMDRIVSIETVSPLGTKTKTYMTGIQSSDGNVIIMVQGNYYNTERMVWLSNQEITFETKDGIKLYTHPNSTVYAKLFLEGFIKANSQTFDYKDLNKENFTKMIVMPNGKVIGMVSNKQFENEKLQELADAIIEIKPD